MPVKRATVRGSTDSGDQSRPAKRRLIDPVDSSQNTLFETVQQIISEENSDKYNIRKLHDNNNEFLEITKTSVDIQSHFGGPTTVARIIIHKCGSSYFQVDNAFKMHVVNLLSGGIFCKTALLTLLDYFADEYKMCGGIPKNEYDEKTQNVRYTPKGYRERYNPTPTVHAENCHRWFKVKRQSLNKQNSNEQFVCKKCRVFMKNSVDSNKRNFVTPEQRKERQAPTSKYPIHLLSPTSRKMRQNRNTEKRRAVSKVIERLRKRLEKTKMILHEEQSKDMVDITRIINEKYQCELETILKEANKTSPETSDIIAESWKQDTLDRKNFFRDQARNMTGNKGNTWSTVTYRVALAIMSRSKSAYEALKSFKILQLPSVSTLKKFVNFRLHDSGINSEIQGYVQEQSNNYKKYKEELRRKGKKMPLGEGLIIFDEVRVTSKVKWSANGEKFFGLELTHEECPQLHDIYAAFDPNKTPQPTSYNLQFLWRDLTSDFDVIGPYFSTANSLEHRYIISCLLETMRLFHQFDFKTVGIVCDGASSNLAAIKILTRGKKGAYGTQPGRDRHKVEPWFTNPFDPLLKVFCCICPSHQLKNHINALYQSRAGGTKMFRTQLTKQEFGWKTICDLWDRENGRRQRGELYFVKGLRHSYIVRDPWTKLSVLPAKIMQQTAVLKELKVYLSTNPADSEQVEQTYEYLNACHKLFESGFLEKVASITAMDSPTLQNIRDGYKFFVDWFEALDGPYFEPTSSVERKFIAWQTWDLLRVCVYGFEAFCKDFLDRHPGYYIVPKKWNGSAMETLFSQFRAIAGGKLDSTNYATARETFLTKRDIHGHRPSKVIHGYLDTPLYARSGTLKRK